jgi:hypothetical protein
MARAYTVVFNAVAVTAAQDVIEITPADDKPIEIVGLFLSQTSDVGDAQDEMLRYEIWRGYTSSGSGGSAPTPAVLIPADTAAGFTAEVNNTTVANTGTAVNLHVDAFNVRAGLQLWFPPECRPSASQANTTIAIRIPAPADSLTMSGTIYVRELI